MVEKKGFVWKSLRISFWVMIVSLIFGLITFGLLGHLHIDGVRLIVLIVETVSLIFTFIISIVHLKKYKERKLAVIALIVSSIIVFLSLVLFLIFLVASYNTPGTFF